MTNTLDIQKIISTEFEQTFSCILQCKTFEKHSEKITFFQFNCCNTFICEDCLTELKHQSSKTPVMYYDDDYDEIYITPDIYKTLTCPACKTVSPVTTEIKKLHNFLLDVQMNISRKVEKVISEENSQDNSETEQNNEIQILKKENCEMRNKILDLQQKYSEVNSDRRSAILYLHSLEEELVALRTENLTLEKKVLDIQRNISQSNPYFELNMLKEELFEIISEMDTLRSEKSRLKSKNQVLSCENQALKQKLKIDFE